MAASLSCINFGVWSRGPIGKGRASLLASDPRITPVGRFLRNFKLDELPQLINVLRGEMSLVGPRPEDPRYVALYTPEQHQVLSVRPGITSQASVYYREEETLLSGDNWETIYREQILPRKLAAELAYLQRRTVWTDLWLILRTAGGSYQWREAAGPDPGPAQSALFPA